MFCEKTPKDGKKEKKTLVPTNKSLNDIENMNFVSSELGISRSRSLKIHLYYLKLTAF